MLYNICLLSYAINADYVIILTLRCVLSTVCVYVGGWMAWPPALSN